MRVAHIVPSITEQASGPSYSVPALCDALARVQVHVSLHVLGPVSAEVPWGCEVHGYSCCRLLPRLGFSREMNRALRTEAGAADIMHNHSLWMMPNIYPGFAVRGTRCRLVTSPRGTLSSWALKRSRLKKHLMWFLCQERAIRHSACFHATSDAECQEIRAAGLRGPIAIIPNGVDVPELGPPLATPGGRRRLLFLGRIHPVKGIDVLIRAWRRVQGWATDWELHVVGPDNDGYLPQMQELAIAIGAKRIFFPGPAYGPGKAEAFRRAEVFVLPTHSENFGVAVAEALSYGLPVIVTRGAPWGDVEHRECGWWIEKGEGPLADCLREVLALSADEVRARGARGRAWMASDFGWPRVGRMMKQTYQWLLGGGAPPDWIRRAS